MEQLYQIEGVNLTVRMPTELDHLGAERIKKETDYYLENYHIQHIIFDFQKTDFMDSAGIGMLLGRYKEMAAIGGEVFVRNTSPRVKRILEMSGIYRIIRDWDGKDGEGSR